MPAESPRKPRPPPESSYLGILSWQDKDLHLLLNTLVMELRLEQVEGHTPCIAAHLIFMCLRYPDHCRKEKQAVEFLQGVIKGIQLVTTVRVGGGRDKGRGGLGWERREEG